MRSVNLDDEGLGDEADESNKVQRILTPPEDESDLIKKGLLREPPAEEAEALPPPSPFSAPKPVLLNSWVTPSLAQNLQAEVAGGPQPLPARPQTRPRPEVRPSGTEGGTPTSRRSRGIDLHRRSSLPGGAPRGHGVCGGSGSRAPSTRAHAAPPPRRSPGQHTRCSSKRRARLAPVPLASHACVQGRPSR